MEFQYVAYTSEKKIVKGVLNANSHAAAEHSLRSTGFEPLSLTARRKAPSLDKMFPSMFAVRPKDIVDFSRQLALLLECGVTISAALQLLQENVGSSALREVIASVNQDIRGGSSFSRALAKHPRVFNELYIRMLAVGERTGSLETSLRQVVNHIEKQRVASKKVSKAMTYPVIVLVVAFGVVVLLTTVVLPQILALFDTVKVPLPLPTQILMGTTKFVNGHLFQLAMGTALLVVSLLGLAARPAGRRYIHRLLLTVPLIGKVTLLSEMSRFASTVSLLLRAGLNMTDVIDLATRGTKNIIMQEALRAIKVELLQGRPMASALGKNRLFSATLVQMVTVGEETGRLEATLDTIAKAYETEAEERTTALISFIEPAMTLFIAAIVGFIALSVVMPMYSIIGSFG